MEETRYQTEVWTYTGIRRGAKVARVYTWQDAEGTDLTYSKLRGSVIGGLYEVQVDRSGEGLSALREVKWTGQRTEDKAKIAQWTAEERLVETRLARESAERKMRADGDAFAEAMKPLQDLWRSLPNRSYAQRMAFAAMVLEALL